MAPLSPETARRVDILFSMSDRAEAERLLVEQCGNNLPFLEKLGPVELERYRYAALKLSGGTIDGLREAIELANTDWRDLLMAAGFADGVNNYRRWDPEREDGRGASGA